MALTAQEEQSGGWVRDLDGRLVVAGASADALGANGLQYLSISTAASGQTALVAAQGSGLKIKVVSYVVVAAGAVTVQFQSASTGLTGVMSLAANGGLVVMSQNGTPVFETAANAALNLNLGGAVQVSGHLAYFVQ